MVTLIHLMVSSALWALSSFVETERVGRHAVRAGRRSYMAASVRSRRMYEGAHSFALSAGEFCRASNLIEQLRNERMALGAEMLAA